MASERQQRQGRPGDSEERDAQAGGEGETASHVAAKRLSRQRGRRLLRARGLTDPQGHLHAACSCPYKTFCRLGVRKGEVARRRQTGLALGSRRLEAEQEHSCSSSLQGAIEVRCLPLALAAVGPAGWKISVRRRKEGGLVPGAVGGGSVSSYLPSAAVPGLPEEPSACSGSGAISIRVTFVPWSCFLHAQMVQSPRCPLVS